MSVNTRLKFKLVDALTNTSIRDFELHFSDISDRSWLLRKLMFLSNTRVAALYKQDGYPVVVTIDLVGDNHRVTQRVETIYQNIHLGIS